MKKHRFVWFLYFAFFITLLSTLSASAYIDPATTSYIIQVIAAIFITAGVVFGVFTTKVKMFFTKIKMKLMEEYYRNKGKKAGTAEKDDKAEGAGLPFGSRLLLAAVGVFSFVFTFFIFGPYDLFFVNKDTFPFPLGEVWLPVLLYGLVIFVVLTLVLTLLRGKAFEYTLTVIIGLLVAGFLQGNLLNINFGQLTGDMIPWQDYTGHMIINLAIWAIIVAIPFVIRKVSHIIWKGMAYVLPLFLVLTQVTSLGVSMYRSDYGAISNEKYLSTDGIYEISSKDNIYVIILDRLDESYIKEILAEDPRYFDDFDGFTRYTNNVNYYCRSYPSVVNMLTGFVSIYDTPATEFMNMAYGESTFIPDLRDANYTTKLYMEYRYTYTDIKQIEDLADNVIFGERVAKPGHVAKKLLRLSAFRYTPHMMKPSFWMTTEDVVGGAMEESGIPAYITDDYEFYQGLINEKLAIDTSKNNFVYYHLNGSHAPFTLNEKVEKVDPSQSSIKIQTKACFNIVREFIQQLKDMGMYEDANIIITGDHGKSYDTRPLDRAVLTGLFVKQKGEFGTPLQLNDAPVNSDNLRGAVIKMAGIKSDKYDPAYWEVKEDDPRIRKYYYRINGKDSSDQGILEEFEIRGDAKDFANWHKIKDIQIQYKHG